MAHGLSDKMCVPVLQGISWLVVVVLTTIGTVVRRSLLVEPCEAEWTPDGPIRHHSEPHVLTSYNKLLMGRRIISAISRKGRIARDATATGCSSKA